MIIIDKVLIIGKRMNGFHMSRLDAELIMNGLKGRNNGVCRTRCSGQHLIASVDLVVIDTRDNVFDIALTGRG